VLVDGITSLVGPEELSFTDVESTISLLSIVIRQLILMERAFSRFFQMQTISFY
jgi:hypothetical protein